jgi:hypothetical protein
MSPLNATKIETVSLRHVTTTAIHSLLNRKRSPTLSNDERMLPQGRFCLVSSTKTEAADLECLLVVVIMSGVVVCMWPT